MGASDPATREKLRELVAKVLEEVEEHGSAAIERACSSHPELAAALKLRIDALRRVGLIGSEAEGGPPFPERLGDFKLLRRLGGGGMGVVYLAEQESLKRKVALKLVRPELLYFANARERFRREVEVVAKLNHPGIVPVYAVDADADVPWFAMEWVDGVSLDELLTALEGRNAATLTGTDLARVLSPGNPGDERLREVTAGGWVETSLRLAVQAAAALQHAHERGVVHRDLKPSNFMLTRDGRVRLVDFGLASTEGTTTITKSSSQLGSLPYTSPEQLTRGIAAVDAKSDVYALGCVLYELLTLRPAYFESEPEQTRRRILEGQHAPIRSLNPAATWDAETVCLTAMERDPDRRYATAADFARDLRRVLDFEPIAARRATTALRLKRFTQRRPALAVGALLGTLLLVGGPTIWAVQEHRYGAQLTRTNSTLAATNKELGEAKQKIEEQLIEERAARASAARSAERAREAILEFLARVGDSVLANVPGATTIRRDLLQRATEQFESLVADAGGDPPTQMQLANAFRLLAIRHLELGDVAKAQRALGRGLELVEGVARENPDYLEWRRRRADLLSDRSMVAFEQEHAPDRALADADEAIALYRGLLTRDEFKPWCRTALGNVLAVRGQVQASLDRTDDAVATLDEAITWLDEAVKRSERTDEARAPRLNARNTLAAVLQRAGRLDAAEASFRRLLADASADLLRHPQDAWTRLVVAAASSNLGAVLIALERQEDAESLLRDAIATFDLLAKDFGLPLQRREAARNRVYLANVLRTIGGDENDEIAPLLEKACELLTPLASPGPNADAIAQAELAEALRQLAERDLATAAGQRGVERLMRAETVAASLLGSDASCAEYHQLAARIERAFANAPADALAPAERFDHATRAFADAATSVRCCAHGVTPAARNELLAAFDALSPFSTRDAAAKERVVAAARELAGLLPKDGDAERRAAPFTAAGG